MCSTVSEKWVHYRARLAWLAAIIGLVLIFNQPVFAQDDGGGSGRVVASPVDSNTFPNLSFYVEAYDADNRMITDLLPEDVLVIEDGQQLPLSKLERLEPGLDLILSINAAPLMANVVNGSSLLAQVQTMVSDWARQRTNNSLDGYSFTTNAGVHVLRETNPLILADALGSYQPDLYNEAPQITGLSTALDLADSAVSKPNSKRAVLYITAPPNEAMQATLPNMIGKASQLGVQVFIWMVSPGGASEAAIASLNDLAVQTGGQMIVYTGVEAVPSVEDWLTPLRYVYQCTYASRIRTSGEHGVAVNVQKRDALLSGAEQKFSIQIAAPNPIFLSPPAQIQRTWSEPTEPGQNSVLIPNTTAIQIMVEFPDGHPRPLLATRLYVDGIKVSEDTQEPFNELIWPLEGFDQSMIHVLKVEAEDSLGFVQASIDTPVDLQVAELKLSGWQRFITDQRLVIGASLLVTGTVLITVLIRTGRKRWQNVKSRKKGSRNGYDPVTQPVNIRQEPEKKPARLSAAGHSVTWPKLMHLADAPARLIGLDEKGQPVPAATVMLTREEMTFGNDPQHAIHVLNSASVEPLHARLLQESDAKFLLVDCGSVAGTWINYAPVSALGTHLEHGDLIHIGRVAFRFELKNPPKLREVQVTPYQED